MPKHATLRFLIYFLCCFCCPNNLLAQYSVTGRISDNAGNALSFASVVALRTTDSTIITTTIADSVGKYKTDISKLENTCLLASSSGYRQAIKLVPNTAATTQIIDFKLERDEVVLTEVSVSSHKPLIERKLDRIVFNVENSISAIGSDALEAISKAPGVRVSGSDEISLAGKSTVSVMLDDKLLQMDGEELAEMLKAIPSDNISRIEVITTPPAKYEAAGNSGMINIVTKKIKKDGLNGNAGITYMQNSFSSFQPEMAFNYRKKKWNIYGNSNGGSNYSKPKEHQTIFYNGQQNQQTDYVDNHHNYHRSQLGADYNITPKAIIGFLYTYGGSTPQMDEHVVANWLNTTTRVDSVISTRAHTNDFGERNVANLNYEWKIDSTGKKLNIDADFFTRTGRTVRDFSTLDAFADGSPTGVSSTNRSTGKQVLYISSVKADMELPTRLAKLSFGSKASFIHVISDNIFQFRDSNTYITDPSKTNKFDYKENTQAIYFSAQRQLNKYWEFQAGLRGEYTQTNATSISTQQTTEKKYFQIFPTAYIQYTHNEDNVFNFNYSRRIERPNMSMINPFRSYQTPSSYSQGNPFLQPSFSSNFEFSYTFKSKYTVTAYTQHNTQVATQVLEVDTISKGFHFNYANIGKSTNYGINLSATLQPAKWWETNIQVFAFHATVNANYYNSASTNTYDRTAIVIENDNSFTLNSKKTLLAEIGINYTGGYIDIYYAHSPNANFDCGLKALFLHKSLVVGFNLNDIFKTEFITAKNLYNGAISDNYYDARTLHLNVTYKFGNKNLRSKREHTGGATEESRRT